MKKGHAFSVILQAVPALVWILLFASAYSDHYFGGSFLGDAIVRTRLLTATLLYLPIIFTVVNFLLTANGKHFLKLNIAFVVSQLSGILLYGILYFRYIIDDVVGRAWIFAFCVFTVFYLAILSVVGFAVKKSIGRRKVDGTKKAEDGSPASEMNNE